MGHAASRTGHATFADLAALGGDVRAEIVGGVIEEKAAPTFEHGDAQGALTHMLRGPFHGRGGGGPGGWWLATEVEVELETHEIFRPDWMCEIRSPSTAARDLVDEHRVLHRFGVPHYWIVDPERHTLVAHRWQKDGYLVALTAGRGDTVRAEPFDAIELPVGLIFGDEPDEERAP